MWFLLGVGCGFSGSSGTELDAGPDEPDARVEPVPVIDFLPASEVTLGAVDWNVASDVRLDTTSLMANPPLPEGVSFQEGTQRDGTTKVAILRVKDLVVNSRSTLTVIGSRPLVILSGNRVTIQGTLDVGAHGAVAGPGGSAGGNGPGSGRPSVHGGSYNDSGGGGGSFGTAGAAGGAAGSTSSEAGIVYTIDDKLVGGASGGTAGACANPPGAGGGALLVYARSKISIEGAITAGGGGGAGGLENSCETGVGAGAGGGSGGTIWLQAPALEGNGSLTANGGGGGGGAWQTAGSAGNGAFGEDGKPSIDTLAKGGLRAGGETSDGGNGATQTIPAPVVPAIPSGNGGGGGGGLGRIVYRAPASGELKSSPTATAAP